MEGRRECGKNRKCKTQPIIKAALVKLNASAGQHTGEVGPLFTE